MDHTQIEAGMQALCALDADIASAFSTFGAPPPRLRPAGFPTFVATIVSQQISTAAAQAIMARVNALLPEMTPTQLLAIDDAALRQAGLSRRKVEYAKGLAKAIVDGAFAVDRLAAMSDNDAIAQITSLRGFG
ncbi:MAG TPA: DNA-3-methyladenine glycosylase 2 family protein, partial [Motiliproteus sp.]